jgi:hypothetical protein
MGRERKRLCRNAASSAALALVALACVGSALAQTVPAAGDAAAAPTGNPFGAAAGAPVGSPTETRTNAAALGVTEGIGETDNVSLTPNDKQSQTLSNTEIDFGYRRTGSALTANLIGDFDYLDYLQGAYSGQFTGRFDGQGALSLWGDRLKWVLEDDYGETQLNPYLPSTPTNLEDTNLLLTGPDLTLRPADQTVLRFDARYALSTYQTSPLDGWRSLESAAIEEELSSSSNVSLNADFMQLHFDDTEVNPDYDNNRYYVRYSAVGARTQIAVSAGVAQSNDGGSWLTTPYGMLDATRQISPEMSLNLSGGRQITDPAGAFSALRAGAAGGIAVAPVAFSMDAYINNYVSGGWHFQGDRTTLGVTARWERDIYDVADGQDVTIEDLELSIGRKLNSVLTAEASGTFYRTDYFNQDFTATQYTGGADVAWQVGRTLMLKLLYNHNFRSTSGGGYGYAANIGFLTLTYQPLPKLPALQ